MDEPNWAEILRQLYQENPPQHPIETTSDSGDFTIDWLVDNTSLNEGNVVKATDKLDSWGLANKESIQIDDWDATIVEMRKDGFEVAHERELSRRNNRINYSLVFLTFVLVLAQIIGVVPLEDWQKLVSALIVLASMLFIIWRTDILKR